MAHRILEVLHYAVWIFALWWMLFCFGKNYISAYQFINWEGVIECVVALFGILIIPAALWYIVAKNGIFFLGNIKVIKFT